MAKSPTKTADDPHPPQVFREADNAARYNTKHHRILPVAGKFTATAGAGYSDAFFKMATAAITALPPGVAIHNNHYFNLCFMDFVKTGIAAADGVFAYLPECARCRYRCTWRILGKALAARRFLVFWIHRYIRYTMRVWS